VTENVDIAIIGAGAAGLMAAIWAGRSRAHPGANQRIVLLDGARTLGAKILVSGGGRCNVTHDVVDETAFAGSSRYAIRKVLRRFDVPRTIGFFGDLGVELKREETGKLFPTTDSARTVLEALLKAIHDAGVEIRNPWRVEAIERTASAAAFRLTGSAGTIAARSVILATGGRSLPKTGSDGHGYELVRSLGHSITPRVFPALVPLMLSKDHWLCGLSGVSTRVTLEVRSGSGRRVQSFTDSLLCTHFGVSGPVAMDISRYLTDARMDDDKAQLVANWLPAENFESVDTILAKLGKVSPGRWMREHGLPARLADELCDQAHVDGSAPAHQLTREKRRELVVLLTQMILPITGDRGYNFAEVTAGGVPLNELRLETMESRICPGLYLIGEICDVDGRIGGYNFQWAWASGFVAGESAAAQITDGNSLVRRSREAPGVREVLRKVANAEPEPFDRL
jgi:predicted Rossmann fold flavoprotein